MKKTSKKQTKKKQILIVDDHPIMRQGLSQLINHELNLQVCGEAEDAKTAMEMMGKLKPDLVLLDISLPDKNGIELIKDFRSRGFHAPVLVVSMHDESLYAERVLRAGGKGYIMKQEGGKNLTAAIQQILSGKVYVSESISAKILNAFSESGAKEQGMNLLSDRELQVFELMGLGKSTREISQQLHISVKTVEVHRMNIKKKLAIKTGTELVHRAVNWAKPQS